MYILHLALKRLELATPILVDMQAIQCMRVARHALTLEVKRSKVMVVIIKMRCRRGSAGQYDCLGF